MPCTSAHARDRWWIKADFANKFNSWNERVLLAAIKENLDARGENEDDMHPFPKASPMVCLAAALDRPGTLTGVAGAEREACASR